MMGLETIKAMNSGKAREAKRLGKLPLILWSEADKDNLRKIPHIGNWRPEGFTLVRELLVDSSGFGATDEPALTFDQFCETAQVGKAYAIIEAGQFQIVAGEFEVSRYD